MFKKQKDLWERYWSVLPEVLKNYYSRLFDLFLGGTIAISLLILQAFISLGSSDLSVFVSVIAFAVAIPMLAAAVVIKSLHGFNRMSTQNLAWIGLLTAYIGIIAAFWHVLWIAAVVFMASSLIALQIYMHVQRAKMEAWLNEVPFEELEKDRP